MKKYLTIVASALLMFAGANLYAQTAAQENLDKAKATLNDAQKHYDKVAKIENRKIDASKDKIADLKLKIDKDNLAINEANALIKQKQQTLKLKKDAYNAEKKALAADGGLSKADKMQLKEREGEWKAISGDIKNDQNSVKALKSSIADKKNAIKREQNTIDRSKAEIAAAKKELSAAKQGVKAGKKAVSAEKKAAAAEAKVAAAEKKAAEKAEQTAKAEAKQAARESEAAAQNAAQSAQARADAAEAAAVAVAAEVAVAQKELAKAEAEKVEAVAEKAAAEASAKFIADAFAGADVQLRQLIAESEAGDTVRIPMSILPEGDVKYVLPSEWTSGFPAGTFWYMYEYTGDEFWAEHAVKFTEALSEIQHLTTTHDLGFMINDSYGNGFRLKGTEAYKEVIVNAAKSLSTRFRPGAGIIQSWDIKPENKWTCPVIIDNMMNLELLFKAFELSADSTFFNIAVSHADKTIQNHFREDFSSWHVVDYNPETGEVLGKMTHQGFSDDSAWARGQSWGLYGFTAAYRCTGFQRYLDQAEGIASYILANLPEDGVPYWDYNAPDIPLAPKDASAGALLASGLYELYGFTNKAEYKEFADKIIASLASPAYTAEPGSNHGFVLLHSVTSFPGGKEIDKPLNYADYYYLEALLRKKAIEKL